MQPLHRLGEFVEDWRFLFYRDGFLKVMPVLAQDIARLPYRYLRFYVLERSLSTPLPVIQPKISLEIRPFDVSDLELVRSIDRPSEARLCAKRLARGQHGLIALHHNLAAGYAWGCYPLDLDLERVNLPLEPGEVLCTDVYTAPNLRRNGVHTALTKARFSMFRDLGYRQAICYIESHNEPSLAVWLRKFEARIIGQISFLRIGAWYRVQIT